ncbi:MAG: uracil-DNA glycosylase [Rhodospirillales bacterium]|jgi:uracil-DNA glycosylase family 4
MTDPQPIRPDRDCAECPRLRSFLLDNREKYPDWHNAPVDSFGDINGEILIVGLAPGLKGANRTGRPFTGDYAGDLLYETLIRYGLAEGSYKADPSDGLTLKNCRITNAVRCLPPENKPIGSEVKNCAPFLISEIETMANLKIVLALGGLAHGAILTVLEERKALFKFGHNVYHQLDRVLLADSYHCSRYNTNTGRLTEQMFHDVFDEILARLK